MSTDKTGRNQSEGLPDITPDMAFAEEDGVQCIDAAGSILKIVKDYLR